jgi:hypothetical protein
MPFTKLTRHDTNNCISTLMHIICLSNNISTTGNNRISGVMVGVLTSSAVDRGFKLRLGQTKDYKIDICCFTAKHTALRSKSKDWLDRNQNNVSK